MVWTKCSINFNTGISGVFCSGDIVTGTVLLEFGKKQTVEYVTFEMIGESYVQWTRPSPTAPYIRNYELKKTVLDLRINLNGVDGQKLRKGSHQTNFLVNLPEELPSSFEGACGYTRYWAKIQGKSAHWFKRKHIVPFQVANKVDLNTDLAFLTPSYRQIEKDLFLAGKLVAAIKLYTGFAPGQRVPFEVTLSNEKTVSLSRLKLSLIQMVTYNCDTGYANEERKICWTEIDKPPSGKLETFHMTMIVLPCPPTTLTTSLMISFQYVIRVELTFPYHFAVVEDIPASVSCIPVNHQYQN